jgi:hypothetical protein
MRGWVRTGAFPKAKQLVLQSAGMWAGPAATKHGEEPSRARIRLTWHPLQLGIDEKRIGINPPASYFIQVSLPFPDKCIPANFLLFLEGLR